MKAFEISPDVAHHLLDLTLSATFEIDPMQSENIARAVDYAWLSDPRTSKFDTSSTALDLDAPTAGISPFEDFTIGPSSSPMTEIDFNFDTPHISDNSLFHELFNVL